MIQVQDLSVRFSEEPVLCGVSLQVAPGECVLLTGPSGCGKSTLARVLTGLIPQVIPAQVEGSVVVAGVRPGESEIPLVAQRVGSVFQNPSAQLFHLKVEDEIAFGPRNLGLPAEQVQVRVEWALGAVGLADLRLRRPSELSGGQKQRVAIAAALAMRPQVLVLDEPTASLDVPGTQQVLAILQKLRQEAGMTILLIEHRLAEAAGMAQRTVIMDQGRIVADGPSLSLLSDRRMLRQLGLRRPVMEPLSGWQDLLEPNGSPRPGVQPLLELQGVTAGYNGSAAIQQIDLALYPGEFAALVGDNGAGKSTLALAACGLLRPSQGKVVFERGRRMQPGRDISMLFQNPADQLFTDCVDEELAFGPRNYRVFDESYHQRLLQEADLAHLRERRPASLSIGQQQRTALAACLSLQPRLVILDEPTLGQDWGHLQRLMDFLKALNQAGTTILLITHDYKLVHRYASRVIWMQAGKIVLDGHIRETEKRRNLSAKSGRNKKVRSG